ncbi:MAG: hypothetical protein V2A34_16440, partial [Lentisphaerota bacterium]
MKQKMMVGIVSIMMGGAVAHGDGIASAKHVTKSLEQISAKAQVVITQQRIHSAFDQYRKLADF